ncbi:ceramide glucosyltransferas-like protein [Lophiotrema nucula]|uniref:Ceramide glucosyltransferase n=1 Tax=Lophiotrema nucula TaxID=690887 RepID=A0A6A5YKE4_9PLEO|nr:ceramide glucosyltransferas-like protein [Lophiotrema nucula]
MRRATAQAHETDDVSMLRFIIAVACLIWYTAVWLVSAVGFSQLFRHYWRRPKPAEFLSAFKADEIPHVTIIRPVKGLEPRLYECLAASLLQAYPKSKLTVHYCVASRSDPALSTIERVLRDFPDHDARLFIEEEDPMLKDNEHALGPNPKIRNMSRAYREAKGDILWILDCNIWVGKGVLGRMVELLCGYGRNRKYKFVHQTPVTIDLDGQNSSVEERKALLGGEQQLSGDIATSTSSDPRNHSRGRFRKLLQRGGGRLDEAFMSSSHAKFYMAINTVAIAPCIIGKSTMFRRSQLNYITSSNPDRNPGIDFFSDNICEDHLVADALWYQLQEFEKPGYQPAGGESVDRWGKHGMLLGDFCFQPISHTSVAATIARRVRWLRVRKFTVTLATFVEPGTESILCNLYGAYAVTTLPFFRKLGIPPTWEAFFLFWLGAMLIWCFVDYIQYHLLHSAKTIELDADTPDFVRPQSTMAIAPQSPSLKPLIDKKEEPTPSLLDGHRRTLRQWWFAWFARELSAFPIWFWAFWGGVTVEWRGKSFWVGLDMKVHEITSKEQKGYAASQAL